MNNFFKSFTMPFGGGTNPEFSKAALPVAGSMFSQPASFANTMANNYGNYSAGLSSLAQAQANERSNWYGSNAMAEAARQGAVGNIGSAMLGAYGGIGNSALAAWAQNQTAYNKAASDMHLANQMGMSQYGQSRNSALGQLGSAYGSVADGLGRAAAVGDLTANFGFGGGGGGGGGFTASGPSGGIASGSFGGGGGMGGDGFYGTINRSTNNSMLPMVAGGVFGGMGRVNDSLMDKDLPNRLDRGADLGRAQIDNQHYTSRMMPSMMMGQAAGDLVNMGAMGLGSSGMGMNQFYGVQTDPRNRADFSGVLSGLTGGFEGTRGDIRSLYDNSIGRSSMFDSERPAPQPDQFWEREQRRNLNEGMRFAGTRQYGAAPTRGANRAQVSDFVPGVSVPRRRR